MSFKEEVRQTLTKIEVQLSIMNAELKEHTKRSTNLEERVKPLEDSHVFFNKLSKSIALLATFLAAAATAYHYLILR